MGFNPDALYLLLARDVSGYLSDVKAELLFDKRDVQRIEAWPDIRGDQFAALALLKSSFKKFVGEKKATADAHAIDKFLEVNEACRTYSFKHMLASASDLDQIIFGEMVSEIHNTLEAWDGPRFSWSDVFRSSYFGPGSSVGLCNPTNSEYDKLTGDLSCTTSRLYDQYCRDIKHFALESSTEFCRRLQGGRVVEQDCSKLSCVLKHAEISRVICSEPSLNTFYQLGLGECVHGLLKKSFGLDFSVQQYRNRQLARVGSATGRFGTLDLTSASDLISKNLVAAVMPAWFTQLCFDLRCRRTRLPDGTLVDLHMISSMGNGSTFPLQSLIFTCLLAAVYRVRGIPLVRPRDGVGGCPGNFAVNGDDIIVVTQVYDDMVRCLTQLGFRVNETKSFGIGPFRESCGGDYFNGRFVRGVYFKRFSTTQDFVSAFNRLNEWSAVQGINLPLAVRYLKRFCGTFVVPRWDDECAGMKLPWQLAKEFVSRTDSGTGSLLYERWAGRPKDLYVACADDIWGVKPEVVYGKNGRKVVLRFNEAGILLTTASGSLRGGSCSVRQDIVRYESRMGIAPCWELYYDAQWRDLTKPAAGLRRWTSAVTSNLVG